MSYEYEVSIKNDLTHLYDIPTGVWNYEEKLKELDEIYEKAKQLDRLIELARLHKKAQAYDDIMKLFDKHTTFIEDSNTNWDSFGEELIESGLIDL